MYAQKTIRFTLTENHLKLLQKFWVDWEPDGRRGAPVVASKCYGNGDVLGDVAEIIDFKFSDVNEDGDVTPTKKEMEYLQQLHEETRNALRICLSTRSFVPSVYESQEDYDGYGHSWTKVG